MDIDFKKLERMIEVHAKPTWQSQEGEWPFRQGGGEIYIQEKVLKNANLYLKQEELKRDPKSAVWNAINAPENNLLSQYDKMYSRVFIQMVNEDELGRNMLVLLYENMPAVEIHLQERGVTLSERHDVRVIPDRYGFPVAPQSRLSVGYLVDIE